MEDEWEIEGGEIASPPRNSGKLSTMLIVAVLALLLFTIAAYATVAAVQRDDDSSREAAQTARLVAAQAIADWDVAGLDVAMQTIVRISEEWGTSVRIIDMGTEPPILDAFEAAAIKTLGTGVGEYGRVSSFQGHIAYRYMTVVPRHNAIVGVVVPMPLYLENHPKTFVQYAGLFVVLAVELVAVIVVALHKLVSRPLEQLSKAAQEVGEGELGGKLGSGIAFGEVAALKRSLDDMEARLKESHEKLEERVRERTVELEEANARLKDEVEYKTTFLSTMSHELRTPLAAIGAYADVWLKSRADRTEEDLKLIEGIKQNAKSLISTINNTLDAASIEAKRFTLDPVETDLFDVVNAVDSVAEPLAREKGIAWSVQVDEDIPLVVIDPNVLHKIMMNLVGNALKFTDRGGEVVMALRADEEAQVILIDVRDTGIGIPPEDLDTIFERFRQADSSISRKYGGSGLGLSLVREMAQIMGGSIRVQSKVGEGSLFSMTLPYDVCKEN